ncbi:MAG TPA: HsdR family type I site-specific deoxyribonuclease [Candidatus Acidoferrales bacterium]|nr:HsdR family type I site-specific deoxyribonuclease [Candidatus Acidoferrales bacterium]
MPGYKQTEVGVIPEDWNVQPLSQIAEIRSGIAKNANVFVRDPVFVHYLRVANVQDGFLDLSEMSKIRLSREDVHKYSVLAGDVLMNEGGDLDKLGRGSVWRGKFDPCVHQNHVFVVRCGSKVSPEFLNYWTAAPTARRYFMLAGKQTTNLASINKTALGHLPVILPCPEEQTAIAAVLSDMDALIESLEQPIAKKRHLKLGAMQELLRPKENDEVMTLKEVSSLKGRIGWQGLKQTEFTLNEGQPFLITGMNFKDGAIRWNEVYHISEDRYDIAKDIQLRPDDVLMTKDGTIGKMLYIDEIPYPGKASLNSHLLLFRPIRESYHPKYLYYQLTSKRFKTFIELNKTGTTFFGLSQGAVGNYPVLMPPLAEQTAIAAVLTDMDAEIAALETKLAKARHDAQPSHGENSPRMNIGIPERATQNRVIALFRDELHYRYLGDWTHRDNNSNIEETLLTPYLSKAGYTPPQISKAIYDLRTEANHHGRNLYGNNEAVYSLLRYGVPVKIEAGQVTETVHLVNWAEPEKNDFAIAEEVTLQGDHERRPDLVLYVNGIAVGVLELKNSRISIGDGIRQSISNQQPQFHAPFFSTVQFIFAGNDSEGMRYGTVGTGEKYFLRWKEDEADNTRFKLDKYLLRMCAKPRLVELIHDFVLFDGGMKKLPRVHQYFGIKAAQQHVHERKGGIIWHTQGSGKSIVMVLLAKWILENNPKARVAIVTDRDELDKQIADVFTDAGEAIQRTSSGRDLMRQLSQARPRLLCSLVHKFGKKDVDNFDQFIRELEAQPSQTVGDIFVFVDECHRTQSGKLHRVMKAIMPNAVFIGFTGTPLLKQDKQTSLEVFGGYIHTYKFSEAVEDEVVLDLIYEARDIGQRLGSEAKIDAWFDAKTKGLNDWQRAALREQWGTMQHVLSSRSRMDRVVSDIVFDFAVKPRLNDDRGNALLVVSSIYEACKYFTLFGKTVFKGRCAVVTSYNPLTREITMEDTGANTETDRQFIYNTYTDLLQDVDAKPHMTKTETYEEWAKKLFKKEPANMKLLVVVDKLLTGFDAPPCTYLYIDKSMRDHGLFQAICRTNRLDGEDKEFGYIVDYKDLFKKVENAIAVYTSELDHSTGGVDPEILLKDRLTKGRERLDNALEAIAMLCEPVDPPKGELEHIHYFCGNTEMGEDLKEHEPRRVAFYKAAAALVRAFANLADELDRASYSEPEIARIKQALDRYLKLREIVRKASGETLDLKTFEADMRHLIDTYIEADQPRVISPFDNMSLLELIVKTGIADAINRLPDGIKSSKSAIAETIENNVRRKIVKEHLNDPAFYDRMSALLDDIIAARNARAIEYEEYLKRIADLAKRVEAGQAEDTPEEVNTPGRRALYNNLHQNRDLALKIDEAVKTSRPDGWRGVQAKEQVVKRALYDVLQDVPEVERIFLIVTQQREY